MFLYIQMFNLKNDILWELFALYLVDYIISECLEEKQNILNNEIVSWMPRNFVRKQIILYQWNV